MNFISLKKLKELKDYWPHFAFQAIIAFIASCVIMMVIDLENEVMIASVGATIFIMFAKPCSDTAQPRHVISGQVIGLTSGICWTFLHNNSYTGDVFAYAGTIATAFILMSITETDHPPAAGTALSITFAGIHYKAIIYLLISIVILTIIHYALRKHMRDLL
jgi:CBS-domain-containing membrane protein